MWGEAGTATLALAAVLLLVLGAGRIARRATPGFVVQDASVLRVRGAVSLGPRRRIYLVEAEGARALIVTGGGADLALLLPPS